MHIYTTDDKIKYDRKRVYIYVYIYIHSNIYIYIQMNAKHKLKISKGSCFKVARFLIFNKPVSRTL